MSLDFLNSTKLNHKDKLEESLKLMSHVQIVTCSAKFAQNALHLYENEYPNDDRVRNAINAALEFAKNPSETSESLAKAAAKAATQAAHAASSNAASNAASSAAYAVHAAATHAAHAAASSARVVNVFNAFNSTAANAIRTAANAAGKANQELLQIEIIKQILTPKLVTRLDRALIAKEWAKALGIEL